MSAGLLAPVLTVDKLRLTEGDDVTAVCTAEGETGFLMFFFRDGPEELYRKYTNSQKVEQKLTLDKGTVNMFCYYSINLGSTVETSSNSNVISIDTEGRKFFFLWIINRFNGFVHPRSKFKYVHILFQFRAGDQTQYYSHSINICHRRR